MPDVIADFCDRLLALDPNVTIRTVDQLCYALRREWGGQRVYISRNPGTQTEIGLRTGLLDRRAMSRTTRWRRG